MTYLITELMSDRARIQSWFYLTPQCRLFLLILCCQPGQRACQETDNTLKLVTGRQLYEGLLPKAVGRAVPRADSGALSPPPGLTGEGRHSYGTWRDRAVWAGPSD